MTKSNNSQIKLQNPTLPSKLPSQGPNNNNKNEQIIQTRTNSNKHKTNPHKTNFTNKNKSNTKRYLNRTITKKNQQPQSHENL